MPVNESESRRAPPSTTSLPSPGFQREAVEVAAEESDVGALAAADVVEAVAADQVVVAGAADQDVVAAAADQREVDRVRGRADDVVAAAAVDRQVAVERRVDELHERRAEQAEAAERDLVVALGAVRGRAVGVGVDLERVGGRQVADADSSSARGADDLDAVEVARQPIADAVAGGAQVEPAVGDRERVDAVAAVDADAVDLAARRTRTSRRRA